MSFVRRDKIFVFFLVFLLAGLSFLFVPKANSQGDASLYFSPSSGKKTVGTTFLVEVRVNTTGHSINAAEGSIVFDPAKLQVISVSKAGSIFTLWAAEPSFSNADGTVNFGVGIPNPGYSGSNGVIITINFKAKTATTVKGYTDVVMVSGAILANDGEGTNILSSLGRANFYLSPSVVEPTPNPEEQPQAASIIKSPTHPDPEKWYSNNNPTFSWQLSDTVDAVSYLITGKPASNPGKVPDGLVSEAKFQGVADGVNYFHLRFRESGTWGSINHFKFQVDTKPPKQFEISTSTASNREPEIVFETSDDLSGIDHYEIKVDEKDWIKIDKSLAGKAYKVSNLSYGDHLILVKAVDMAGNSTVASINIKIPGGIFSKFTDTVKGLLQNPLFPAFLVVLAALIFEFVAHSKWWRVFRKRLILKLKRKKNKSNVLDLRDVKK